MTELPDTSWDRDCRKPTQECVDDGLRWDAKREVWVGSDGFAYDGERLFAYSRGGRV